MEKLEMPNWHLKFGAGTRAFKATIWDLKIAWRSALFAMGLYRARRNHGGKCLEQPACGSDVGFRCARVSEDAGIARRQTRSRPKTRVAGERTEEALGHCRCPRSRGSDL